jgi:hypothetical protein
MRNDGYLWDSPRNFVGQTDMHMFRCMQDSAYASSGSHRELDRDAAAAVDAQQSNPAGSPNRPPAHQLNQGHSTMVEPAGRDPDITMPSRLAVMSALPPHMAAEAEAASTSQSDSPARTARTHNKRASFAVDTPSQNPSTSQLMSSLLASQNSDLSALGPTRSRVSLPGGGTSFADISRQGTASDAAFSSRLVSRSPSRLMKHYDTLLTAVRPKKFEVCDTCCMLSCNNQTKHLVLHGVS